MSLGRDDQLRRSSEASTTLAAGRVQLVCPQCAKVLAANAQTLVCVGCRADYQVVGGIPILSALPDDDPCAEYKRRQIDFFDAEAADFETTRPQGQPRLYGWLMMEKLRRSVRGVEHRLPGATVLTVCGGSGMDAEFLARQGALVIASDLSLGAVERAVERGRRAGLSIDAVVADAEHLPFEDRSVDIVYVHDGLHHLSDPMLGLAEMCRVARRCVLVTEPSRAAVTTIAVRLGVALELEDAGNRVERVSAEQIGGHLALHGFQLIGACRYAMYYQHEPGRWMRFFSRRRSFPVARLMITAFNAALASMGNKLSVRAERASAHPTALETPPHESPEVRAGLLPERYGYAMQDVLMRHARPLLKPGMAILDVGSGRSASIAPEHRPSACRYVGLDISADELRRAAPQVYDSTITHDITKPLPQGEQFDLILSWQVLEHVRPTEQAIENLRAALHPGGTMLVQVSGTFSAFALLARLIPHRARVWAMAQYLGHAEEEKFPTHYDHCWASALERMCSSWSAVTLYPFYRGAGYFGMSRLVQRAYLQYESAVAAREIRNLATHYLVVARR